MHNTSVVVIGFSRGGGGAEGEFLSKMGLKER